MKIPIHEISKTIKVSVCGDEDWLRRFYSLFQLDRLSDAGKETSYKSGFMRDEGRLKAELMIEPLPGSGTYGNHTFFRVFGELTFCPRLACGRCGEAFALPLHLSCDAIFQKVDSEAAFAAVEHALNREELEQYFIDKDCTIDLEMLINDTVQCAIPDYLNPDLPQVAEQHQCARGVLEKLGEPTGRIASGRSDSEHNIAVSEFKDSKLKESPFAKLKDFKFE